MAAPSVRTTNEPLGKQPPGPRDSFPLGNLRAFRKDPIGTLASGHQQHGDLFEIRFGPRVFYVASSPELAQEIMVNDRETYLKLQRFDGSPAGLQLILGNGLVTNTDHDSWLVQRRMIQPMFHRRQIMALGNQITAAGERLLARWEQLFRSDAPINLSAEMMRVTLDVINRTMFGADLLDQVEQIGPAVNTAAEFTFRYETNPIRLPLSWPTPANRRFRSAKSLLYGILDDVIDERRRSDLHRGDLLDMLLDAQDEETGAVMSDQQLRDEVITIFAAGHETTSHALSWTWYLLAQHPEKRARLEQELDDVLSGRTPTTDDLAHLPYTQAVFEESLRLFPPVPAIPRVISQDTMLASYTLKAGNRIIVSVRNIHRHPRHWSQPDEFLPERFLPGSNKPLNRLAYLPFGAGPRLCVGRHLALVEGALLLAQLAQQYAFHLTPGHPVVPDLAITMRPKYGLLVNPEKRIVARA